MYLANSTRPDITFVVNLLASHNVAPTKCHWVGVKTVFRYLNGNKDLGLFYSRNQDPILLGYTYDGYLICHIPIMTNHKQALYSYKEEEQFSGNLQSRH
jgi:hypothetical protein